MKRKTLWFFWRCLLVATVLFAAGCHWVTGGGYSEAPAESLVTVGICDKGTFKCNKEHLLRCAPDQQSWMSDAQCASKDHCDSKAGVCTVCPEADMLRCSGAKREACSPDRSSWLVKETCVSADICDPFACRECPVPGQLQCAAEPQPDGSEKIVLKQCDGTTKRWVTLSTCLNDDVCMHTKTIAETNPAAWQRDKCEGVCIPGTLQCDDKTLKTCSATGLEWEVMACNSKELCQRTLDQIKASPDMGATIEECDPGCETAGKPRCTNNVLERCSDDLTTWNPVMPCGMGLQCSTNGQGDCIVCTPGEYQCNGKTLQKCLPDRTWGEDKDCLQPALCKLYPDANGLLVNGSCEKPACDRPGTYVCGSETDPKVTPGKRLYYCHMDQNSIDPVETCATPELCNMGDGKCIEEECKPGARRCDPNNPLNYQACNAGQTGWDLVTTCAAGQFCDPTNPAQPCQHQCSATTFCNGRFRMTCSNAVGVKQQAECETQALCECSLNNTCPNGTLPNGCGSPVCGGTGANYRCTDTTGAAAQGPLLQKCNDGRNGWTAATPVTDCGSAALCYPGQAPSYMGGYCAICPVAGEVACNGSATRTCSADRKTWSAGSSCGYGCVADASTMDYCAACMVDERRCSGNQLLGCSADRKSTPVVQDCSFGCVNSGTADYCGTCGVGEKRCTGSAPGSSLQTCNAEQNGLGMNVACANGCIDSGRADYCADCVVGSTRCSGAGVQTCGVDGKWGAVSACADGCTVGDGVAFCAGCGDGERRCSGTTLQECAADRRTLTTVATCANGCIDSGMADYCAQCGAGELRCNGSELRSCTADRRMFDTVGVCEFGCMDRGTTDYCAVCAVGELRCNDNTLQTCNTDRTGLINSQNCTNECHEEGIADYCGVCRAGAARCGTATGTRQVCGDNGRWPAVITCPNGNACYGNEPNAYCGECKPGDTRCSGSSIQTCGNDGRWSAMSTQNCAPRACIDSGDNDYCADCSAGDTTCSGSTLLSCNPLTGRYPTTGTNCDKGCVGTAPAAECAVCMAGERNCSGNNRQECINGRWVDDEVCAIECINSGTADFCAECASGDAQCVENNTSRRTCTNGRWDDPVPCSMNACVGKDCAACTPGTVQCAAGDSTSYRMCSNAGTWGTPMACPNRACFENACVDCMPNAEECTDASRLRTCSANGSWQAPVECPNHSCLNDECVDCVPDATDCVDSQRQRTCNASGRWGTAMLCDTGACVDTTCTACVPNERQCMGSAVRICSAQGQWLGTLEQCDNGCVNNGNADYCQECAEGASECVDQMTLQVCDGSWMMSPCPHGCFNVQASATDYCRDCGIGARECLTDTTYRACDDEGHWGASTPCENHCLDTTGTCVACKPGTTMCSDVDGQQLCGASGSWSDPEPCPNGCMGDVCAPPPPTDP